MEKTAPTLGPREAGIRLTAEQFAAARFEEPYQYERVGGRLVVISPSGPEHRRVSRPFRRVLGGYWQSHSDLVDDVDVEGWVATDEDTDRIPDICVYLSGEKSSQVVPRRVPDLVFEFVSSNRADQERDYIFKRREYHEIGVREYVIVDRLKKEVLVLTWEPDEFSEHILTPNDKYTSSLLPGIEIPLAEAFAKPQTED